MNFQLAQQGRSFKGAMAYYLHDKQASTDERVAWTETRNLMTDDARTATRVMIATAESADELKAAAGVKATGRKAQNPVMAFSLAWHPSEAGELDRQEMTRAADEALKVLGLQEHQSVLVAHRDTAHPHVHVIVNRVSQSDGRMAKIDPNKVRALDRWANKYELDRGHVVSPNRAKKYDLEAEKRRQHPEKDARREFVQAKKSHAEEHRARAEERAKQIAGNELAEQERKRQSDLELEKLSREMWERKIKEAVKFEEVTTQAVHKIQWEEQKAQWKLERKRVYETHGKKMKAAAAELRASMKPEWKALYREKKQADRRRGQMALTFKGRWALAVVAAQEQQGPGERRGMVHLAVANFFSRSRMEEAFAAAFARDKERLRESQKARVDGLMERMRRDRAEALESGRKLNGGEVKLLKARQGEDWRAIRKWEGTLWEALRHEDEVKRIEREKAAAKAEEFDLIEDERPAAADRLAALRGNERGKTSERAQVQREGVADRLAALRGKDREAIERMAAEDAENLRKLMEAVRSGKGKGVQHSADKSGYEGVMKRMKDRDQQDAQRAQERPKQVNAMEEAERRAKAAREPENGAERDRQAEERKRRKDRDFGL